MHKMLLTTIVGLLAAALATPLTMATHGGCNGVITQIDAGSETLYIDDRSNGAVTINHWIYLESNGQEGLQTGGSAPYDGLLIVINNTDSCSHNNPDTILF